MSYNEIQNDKIQQAIIKVEALQKEYEITIQQYEEASKNYINALQNENVSSESVETSTTEFTVFKGRTWWGSGALKEGVVETQDECENMCLSSDKCSGATFNPVKHYCWTRSGEGTLNVGNTDDTALLPKQKAALIVMQGLNSKLIILNNKITTELAVIKPEVEAQANQKNIKHQELNSAYQQLLEQKLQMERKMQQYYTVEEDANTQSLFAKQQYFTNMLWIILVCLVIIITINRYLNRPKPTLSKILWLILICVLLIMSFSLTYAAGFLMWLMVLCWIILMKTGNLPSI